MSGWEGIRGDEEEESGWEGMRMGGKVNNDLNNKSEIMLMMLVLVMLVLVMVMLVVMVILVVMLVLVVMFVFVLFVPGPHLNALTQPVDSALLRRKMPHCDTPGVAWSYCRHACQDDRLVFNGTFDV